MQTVRAFDSGFATAGPEPAPAAPSPAAPATALEAWKQAAAGDLTQVARACQVPFAVGLVGAGRSFLAVDRFAIHSLCYRTDRGRVEVAARADQLANDDDELDPQALFDYLYFHAIPSPKTVFKGIRRLPAAHCGSAEGDALKVTRYWTPEFAPDAAKADFDALAREFRQVLRDSVSRSLDGTKPACFLSGGTDSSTVAGVIGEVAGRAAATYSIGFDAEGYDEMAYARIAARRFGTEHHEYYVTPDDLVRSIGEVAAAYDQPFGNSSALPAYYCARSARADGVTRILAGDGGDELFGGNSRYAKQRIFGLWQGVPGAVRDVFLEPLLDNKVTRRVPLVKKGSSYIEQARVPMPDRMQMYNLLRRLGFDRVLTPAFLSQVDPEGPARQQREVWSEVDAASELNRTLAFDWRYTLAESDLPKVCGTTALAGVSVAFPLLDPAVVDFSLRLPTRFKLRGVKLRWFFKEALRGFLPDEILTKKKHGFGLPFGVWVTRHAALQQLATDSVRSLVGRGLVQRDFVDALLRELLPAHPGYYGEMVWILMMLEQWLRHHRPEWRVGG